MDSRLLLSLFVLFLIDVHIYVAMHRLTKGFKPVWRSLIRGGLWVLSALAVLALAWIHFTPPDFKYVSARQWVVTGVLVVYVSKLFSVLFILIDDIQVGIRMLVRFIRKRLSVRLHPESLPGKPITRSDFLMKSAIVAGVVPFSALVVGIVSGASNYRVIRKTIYLPNLPKAFDGLRIAHISDIHTGTPYIRKEVIGGVEMLMNEKADLVFFTGDLVNNDTSEVNDYLNVFGKVKAPLGVYSVLGNHDYGNYRWWPSDEAKQKNFQAMLDAHRVMGYDLLMNEHRFLEESGEKIAVLGVENWGEGPQLRFPKYGKLDEAHKGTEEAAVKLLLSHDPSHWDAQVRPLYPDIDVTFSGHTHGFQMGVEVGDLKWSPSQYLYKQWAGLYQNENQHIYVNRGFGCIGYPGRIGMPPEITLITLKRKMEKA